MIRLKSDYNIRSANSYYLDCIKSDATVLSTKGRKMWVSKSRKVGVIPKTAAFRAMFEECFDYDKIESLKINMDFVPNTEKVQKAIYKDSHMQLIHELTYITENEMVEISMKRNYPMLVECTAFILIIVPSGSVNGDIDNVIHGGEQN